MHITSVTVLPYPYTFCISALIYVHGGRRGEAALKICVLAAKQKSSNIFIKFSNEAAISQTKPHVSSIENLRAQFETKLLNEPYNTAQKAHGCAF